VGIVYSFNGSFEASITGLRERGVRIVTLGDIVSGIDIKDVVKQMDFRDDSSLGREVTEADITKYTRHGVNVGLSRATSILYGHFTLADGDAFCTSAGIAPGSGLRASIASVITPTFLQKVKDLFALSKDLAKTSISAEMIAFTGGGISISQKTVVLIPGRKVCVWMSTESQITSVRDFLMAGDRVPVAASFAEFCMYPLCCASSGVRLIRACFVALLVFGTGILESIPQLTAPYNAEKCGALFEFNIIPNSAYSLARHDEPGTVRCTMFPGTEYSFSFVTGLGREVTAGGLDVRRSVAIEEGEDFHATEADMEDVRSLIRGERQPNASFAFGIDEADDGEIDDRTIIAGDSGPTPRAGERPRVEGGILERARSLAKPQARLETLAVQAQPPLSRVGPPATSRIDGTSDKVTVMPKRRQPSAPAQEGAAPPSRQPTSTPARVAPAPRLQVQQAPLDDQQ